MALAKGPPPGETPKADALAALRCGARCERVTAKDFDITGYVVTLDDGRQIASAASAQEAWRKAETWALNRRPGGDDPE